MSNNLITEAQLASMGIMIDPEGHPVQFREMETPDESMTLPELAIFIQHRNENANRLGRAEAVERFYQGWAIHLAHDKCRAEGTLWKDWCADNHVNCMSANRFERLYMSARKKWGDDALANVSQHSITELYEHFGILKRPDKKRRPQPAEPEDDSVGTEKDGDPTTNEDTETDTTDTGDGDGDVLLFPKQKESQNKQASQPTPSKKPHSFSFSDEVLTTVTDCGPDLFMIHLQDTTNGEVDIVVYRNKLKTIYQQIEKAMDENDGYDADEIPETMVERNGRYDANNDPPRG